MPTRSLRSSRANLLPRAHEQDVLHDHPLHDHACQHVRVHLPAHGQGQQGLLREAQKRLGRFVFSFFTKHGRCLRLMNPVPV